MKKYRSKQIKKCMLFLSALFFVMCLHAQNNTLFNTGKDLYKNDDFQGAISNWKQILETGNHSASLYYNLGNAHYKLNQIGPSIYFYEKALKLSPNDSDIKNNLAFAQNARIDAIEPLPKTIFSKWYASLSGVLNFDGWAVVSVIGAIGFVLFFLLYYFSYSEKKKRLFFTSSIVGILVFIVGFVMAFQTHADVQKDRPAIIFAESTDVKSAPSIGSESVFILHEGTKVQVIEEDQDWMRIKLVDGKDGWLPKSELKTL